MRFTEYSWTCRIFPSPMSEVGPDPGSSFGSGQVPTGPGSSLVGLLSSKTQATEITPGDFRVSALRVTIPLARQEHSPCDPSSNNAIFLMAGALPYSTFSSSEDILSSSSKTRPSILLTGMILVPRNMLFGLRLT